MRAARALRAPESWASVWWRLILTSFVVTILVFGARSAHLLEGIETWWLDRMLIADRVRFEAPIALVAITDADYFDPALFDGISPLHPETLRSALERILAHRPRGVVMDVQIHPAPHESEERAEARRRLYRLLDQASAEAYPPIVLVRDLEAEARGVSGDTETAAAWDAITSNERLWWADPSIARRGGYVRGVPRRSDPRPGVEATPLTVLGAAIEAFGLEPHPPLPWWVQEQETRLDEPWRIRFSGHFLTETPALTTHRVDLGALLSGKLAQGQASLLTDRIVLLGGTHHAGRDLQPTVVGDMPGVYVWAEAIASWMRQDALREPLGVICVLLEFLVGVLTGLILVRLGPALGLLCALLVAIPLTVVNSILAFGDGVLFVNFLPSVVCVFLHYQIEVHLEIRRLRKRLARLQDPALQAHRR